jgi:hypothetical protein
MPPLENHQGEHIHDQVVVAEAEATLRQEDPQLWHARDG